MKHFSFAIYFSLLFSAFPVWAQLPDSVDLSVDTLCSPAHMVTIYDWNKTQKLSLDQIRMYYSFGTEHFKNGNYQAAIPNLWKVFIHDTTRYAKPAVRKLTECYYKLNRIDSTLIVCYRGLERFPMLPALHHYAGYIQDFRGNLKCALSHYVFLVSQDSSNEYYLQKLAEIYFRLDDERAIATQKRLVSLHPDNSEYQRRLANYLSHFDYDPLDALREAFLNDPENPILARDYGKVAMESGQFQQALLPFGRLVQQDSSDWFALISRARCYEAMESYPKAIADYKNVLLLQPEKTEIMCQIAFNYKNMNHFAEASSWIKKALRAKPGYGLAHLIMGEIYEAAVGYCQDTEKRGRKIDDGLVYRLAMQEYKLAMKDQSTRAEAQKRLGYVEPLIDSKEERFMADHSTIQLPCYTDWIKP